jgi:hypothetical protein
MSDLEIRDTNGHIREAEAKSVMVESNDRIELDELLHSRLEDAVGIYGMVGVLGVLWDIAAKRPQQNWGEIRDCIGRCAEVVERCEMLVES